MLDSAETSPAERLPSRRTNKPLVEKRRRERINCSLSELKRLLLEAMKQDGAQFSRLEKADILEMTVKYLKHVQRQQCVNVMAASPSVAGKYRAGFSECAGEVMKYIDNANGVDTRIRDNLNQHLSECLTVVGTQTAAANNINSGNASPSYSSRLSSSSPSGQNNIDDNVAKQLNIQIPESTMSSAYRQTVNSDGYHLLMPIAQSTPIPSSMAAVRQCETDFLAGTRDSNSSSPQVVVRGGNNGLRCITNIYQSRFSNSDKEEHAPAHKRSQLRQMSSTTSPLTSKQTTLRQHPYSRACDQKSRQTANSPRCSFRDEKLWRPW